MVDVTKIIKKIKIKKYFYNCKFFLFWSNIIGFIVSFSFCHTYFLLICHLITFKHGIQDCRNRKKNNGISLSE